MNEIKCEVCFRKFSSNNDMLKPRILKCGHSFCSDCITDFFHITKRCAKCRMTITSKKLEMYAVNYALLDASDTFYSSFREPDVHEKLNATKKKYKKMEQTINGCKIKYEKDLSIIKDSIVELDRMKSSLKSCPLNAVDKKITDMENKLREIASNNLPSIEELKNSMTIKQIVTKDIPSKIYTLISNGEDCYAVNIIKGEIQYGKFTIRDQYLMFHAFKSAEKKENIQTIWFQELKDVFNAVSVKTFFQLPLKNGSVHTLVYAQLSNNVMTPQFLNYCTGECGVSYHGAEFHIMNVPVNSEIVMRRHVVIKDLCTVINELDNCCYTPSASSLGGGSMPDPFADKNKIGCSMNRLGGLVFHPGAPAVYYNSMDNNFNHVGFLELQVKSEKLTDIWDIQASGSSMIKDCGIIFEVQWRH